MHKKFFILLAVNIVFSSISYSTCNHPTQHQSPIHSPAFSDSENDTSSLSDDNYSYQLSNFPSSDSNESVSLDTSRSSNFSHYTNKSHRPIFSQNTENIFDYTVRSLQEISDSINNKIEAYYIRQQNRIHRVQDKIIFIYYQNILQKIDSLYSQLQRIQDDICLEINIFQDEYSLDKRINRSDIDKKCRNIKKIIQLHIISLLNDTRSIIRAIESSTSPIDEIYIEQIRLIQQYVSKLQTIQYRLEKINISDLSKYLYQSTRCRE